MYAHAHEYEDEHDGSSTGTRTRRRPGDIASSCSARMLVLVLVKCACTYAAASFTYPAPGARGALSGRRERALLAAAVAVRLRGDLERSRCGRRSSAIFAARWVFSQLRLRGDRSGRRPPSACTSARGSSSSSMRACGAHVEVREDVLLRASRRTAWQRRQERPRSLLRPDRASPTSNSAALRTAYATPSRGRDVPRGTSSSSRCSIRRARPRPRARARATRSSIAGRVQRVDARGLQRT